MSQQLINHSVDLQQLLNDGYNIEIRSNYLLIKDVPYVNSRKEIGLGILVSELSLAGNVTTTPSNHIVYFIGSYPCNKDGSEIGQIRHQSTPKEIDCGFVANHSFSSKPPNGYKDYYEKMTTYAAIISSPAQSIDPCVTAKTFRVIEPEEDESVFNYIDTASSRVGINVVTKKLEIGKIGIVGLGGTGSYILDLVAKTPVREIHLFDGDKFLQHNAFRSPGAPSIDELRKVKSKAVFFQEQYSKMHRHIIAHNYFIDASNVDKLCEMDFVFLCLDRGGVKKLITEKLKDSGISFIDVGMGVYQTNGSLGGVLRVTSSSAEQHEHIKAKGRIPFSDGDDNNAYSQNIQIADLNALNATLAVIKWKKQFGFYLDLEKEYHSTYTIDGNTMINDDRL